ncbi:MAG: CPBP family intramembrane metalloprotease [Clostridiales bacterium]|nr:CPBP family intramembrane metalloprotease [Clostridiales bacterium]
MDKKKVIKFVVITYVIAWTLQIIGSLYLVNNPGMTGTMVFQGCLAVCMFAPLVAALIANRNLKGMGWKPKFKGNIGWLFFAAYVTIPLMALGAALFFVIFPNLFDGSGSMLIAQTEAQGVDLGKMLEQSGIDIRTYMIIQTVPAALIAPFINIITAIGEEAGWRGFLYPEINKSFGKIGTWLIGGTIWGVFHFPAMIFGGYEYGFDYIGAPVLGLVTFTVCCIVLGILEEVIYDRTKCIWYAALLHGSFNAIATIPQLFMNANDPDINKYLILGPLPNGLISMIPFAVFAVILGAWSIRRKRVES